MKHGFGVSLHIRVNPCSSVAKLFLLCLWMIVAAAQAAKMEPAEPQRGRAVARITWFDEHDQPHQLAQFAGFPVILLPFYTHCSATCPLNIAALKRAISQSQADPKEYRVLLFSFDENENAASLAALRRDENLPLSWAVGRADAENIEALTNSIGFQFGRAGSEFTHPNILLVLDAKLAIAKWIYGSNYRAAEIDNALEIAAGKNDWLGRNAVKLYGITLFVVSLLAVALAHVVISGRQFPSTQRDADRVLV